MEKSEAQNNSLLSKRKRKRHKNSRNGCLNCKKRRIKCGEELDSCYNCIEKNLWCSFVDLPAAEKQKLRDKFEQLQECSDGSNGLEKEFQELVKQGYDFRVEKLDLSVNLDYIIDQRALPDEEELYSVLAFNKPDTNMSRTPSIAPVNSSNVASNISLYVRESRPKALANAIHSPTILPLYNIKRHKLLYELLGFDVLENKYHTVCGEDGIVFEKYRAGLENWYQALIDYSAVSLISFHKDVTLSGNIVLNALIKSPENRHSEIVLLKKFNLLHKVTGLKLAQNIIDLLNRPNDLPNERYLAAVHKIIGYSLVSSGVSMLQERDYKSFLAFVGGFLSSALIKQIIRQYAAILESESFESLDADSIYQFKFLRKVIPVIHSFFLSNIITLYMPNYNFDILAELYDDLAHFDNTLLSENHRYYTTEFQHQAKLLRNFLYSYVLNDPNLYKTYNQEAVFAFDPQAIWKILCEYFSIFPSHVVHIQQKQHSMTTLQQIFYLYWIATSAVLDNIFPEVIYISMLRFSGVVKFFGFDMSFVDRLFKGLERDYKQQYPSLYEYLYRRAFYLVRYVSFFSYRCRLFDRNIAINTFFPDTPLFDQVRYESRKLKFINETQITKLKTSPIAYQHYPVNNPSFVDDNSQRGLAKPNHRKHVSFIDKDFHINRNTNVNYNTVADYLQKNPVFNIDTVPLSLLEFSEYGLLANFDYRPSLHNRNWNRVYYNDDFFDQNEKLLKGVYKDWTLVTSHSTLLDSQNLQDSQLQLLSGL